jgi:hypothetical protein
MAIRIDIDTEKGLTVRTDSGVARAHGKSGDYSKDINGFLDLVAEAWEDFQNRYAVPRANWVPVKYMRPKEFVETPEQQSNVILFKLISRKRFNSTADGERRARTPATREEFTDPDDDTNIITLLGQKRENMIEFEVWSTHSKKANEVALQFEGFMEAYDWYFTSKGINRVWFEERMEDRIEETGATEWSVRTLRYQVTTELIYKETDKKLGTITVRHDSGSKLKTTVVNEETGLKEHSIDRGDPLPYKGNDG